MKHELISIVGLFFYFTIASAQTTAISPSIQVKIVKEFIPANINIVDGSLQFIDYSGNNAIDANETCYIRFKVSNTGKGPGEGCRAKIQMNGTTSAIKCIEQNLPIIKAGETTSVEIPINASMNTKSGKVHFRIEVTEPQGFGSDPADIEVAVNAFIPPHLKIVDSSVTSSLGGTQLKKKEPFDLQLMLQNTEYGKAEDIQVTLTLPDNVFLLDGLSTTKINELVGGKARSLVYSLNVSNNYTATTIPIQVKIKEKYGKYSEDKAITLQLNQSLAANKLNIEKIEEKREDIQIAQIGSVVDKVPATNAKNNKTIAVIIANEKYSHHMSVPYAQNDGNIFREYCIKTLGIPETRIRYVANATGNDMKTTLNWLANVTEFATEKMNIIFYYAGHGVPDETNMSAYLLPVDGTGSDVSTGYKLSDLYATLGALQCEKITIFLDACFSGSTRGTDMLVAARSVARRVETAQPQGKMVVFSAAQGDQTAFPNKEEGHGLFTYYLLKKLQDTKGETTLKELGNYIISEVSKESLFINNKKQVPCVIASPIVSNEWQNWKLK